MSGERHSLRRATRPAAAKHPARYTPSLMPYFEDAVRGYQRVLDPMAGTGRIHQLPNRTVGVEIEPEWAEIHPDTLVADCCHLPFADNTFDAIVVSPCYGNRFADHHVAKDGSLRRSYTHDLGRDLHPNNSGTLQWGPAYREFHVGAWNEASRVLMGGGRFVLNCKDHIRKGEVQRVTEWHIADLTSLGFVLVQQIGIPTGGMGMGAHRDARTNLEWIVILDKKEPK